MSALDVAGQIAWCAAAVVAALLLAWLGARAAALLGQPKVVGEIAAGLLAGPAMVWIGGERLPDLLLPGPQLTALKVVGEVGLVLFLVGVAHHLRGRPVPVGGRGLGAVVAGSLLVPLAAGALAAWWVSAVGGPELRGDAPAAAFVLFMAVALAVTAVPVLARLLSDRQASDSPGGRMALASAMVIDAIAWVLLAVAVGLAGGGGWAAVLIRIALLGGCVLAVSGVRRLLAGAEPTRAVAPVLVGLAALGVAALLEHAGLTAILGAVVVGLALPATPAWVAVSGAVVRWGRVLLPVFFLASSVGVFAKDPGPVAWSAIAVVTAFAVVGKVGGSYLGGRWAGLDRRAAAELGVLLNTRGLTEIVVLQAGHAVGVITTPLYLALIVMALVTTAMTGPLHALLTRRRRADESESEGTRR